MNRIAIIDGNSLINRAYYAMRNPMITKEGIFTHGIFGFINMLEKIKRDYNPEYMVIAYDLKAPTFRHKEYDDYKAGRKKMPPELAMQIPLLKDVMSAMNICQLEIEGFEADDIIGTVARWSEQEGLEPFIITGDKDELQLATDITKIILTKKGVSEFELYDKNAMIEHYGFTPTQFIDYKGLMGDKSDNIPGIPGVGEKTASRLIIEYKSIENILENIENIKPAGLKKKIEENMQLALMSKRLATINTFVPLDIDIAAMKLGEPDFDRLIELYTKLEFNKFLKQLKISPSTDTEASQEIVADDIDSYKKVLINNFDDLQKLKLEGDVVIKVFGDNNHVNKPLIEGIGLINSKSYYYFDYKQIKGFEEWFNKQKINLIGHDIKDDYYMLISNGMTIKATSFDTAVAQYVLDSGRSNYSITALSTEYLHLNVRDYKTFVEENGQVDLFTDTTKAYMDYGFEICFAVKNLVDIQKRLIIEENLEKVYYEVEIPLISVIADMESAGFKVDKNELIAIDKVLIQRIDVLKESIYTYAEEEFNINSTKQLGDILFEKMGLPAGKKTKRGYSTSAEVLENIRDKHPIIDAVLEYRTMTKLKSTYIDGLLPLIDPDGKIHAHFQQTVTATGRLSCTEPNLQNIPIRQELGRTLRRAFVADNEDCVLTGADYSQIELRVLAHMSQDSSLIAAFNNGEDIHRATAANVLGIPESEITLEERSRAKAVNFGVIYGMSAFGLSSELSITRKEADDYIKTYFEKHIAVKGFMDEQVALCKDNGFVTTMLGRKRYIKEINASAYMVKQIGERLAMNTPIQGTAADIIKIAMVKVHRALTEGKFKSRLILQVHDELIINTHTDEKERVKELLIKNMEEAFEMSVKLKADFNEGYSWYELK